MTSSVEIDFERLLQYLKQSRGFDFSAYKRTTLQRRVQKRMQQKHINSYSEYVDYLDAHADEFQGLFNTILINVTAFFRDPEDWKFLAEQVIPQILSSRPAERPLRIWSAGCASGEEAYSAAMILSEALGPDAFKEHVKIYATDVDEEALAMSRTATYTAKDIENVPAELLEKYFETNNSHKYIFDRDVRRSVIFGRHDLIQDAPISRVDLLLCRNTLMYFNAEAQDRILSRFYFGLNDGGFLFLGKAETLLSHNSYFSPFDVKRRIFTKIAGANRYERRAHGNQSSGDAHHRLLDGHVRLRETVLDSLPLAQVVVDAGGRLYLANERARALFNLAARDIGRPIQDLEISYRPVELRSAIEQASTSRRVVEHKEVSWSNPNGDQVALDPKVSPLFDEVGSTLGVAVTWEDVTHFKRLQDELINFNQELETAYEELQSTNEELQTTNEELQSTVEELETTNEELQSTNEELETMNEELQSTNEELETINEEVRQRSDDLNEANAFLHAILAGFSEGVIVLDRDLHVLAWNPKSQDLWGLRPDEVLGKHFLNLDILLPLEQVRPLIKVILSGKSATQALELDTINRRGKSVHLIVRVTPLPTATGEPRGAIISIEEKPTRV